MVETTKPIDSKNDDSLSEVLLGADQHLTLLEEDIFIDATKKELDQLSKKGHIYGKEIVTQQQPVKTKEKSKSKIKVRSIDQDRKPIQQKQPLPIQKIPEKQTKEKIEGKDDIMHMNIEDILQKNGFKEGIEIIRANILKQTNIERSAMHINILTPDESLNICAQKHAKYVAGLHDWDKKNPHLEYDAQGREINDPGKRTKQEGYQYITVAENIYISTAPTIMNTINAWKKSPGHHRNMFSNTKDIGIGYYDGVVVVLYGKK